MGKPPPLSAKSKGQARAQARRQVDAAVGGIPDPLGRRQFIGPVLPTFKKKKRPGRKPNSPDKKVTLTVANLLFIYNAFVTALAKTGDFRLTLDDRKELTKAMSWPMGTITAQICGNAARSLFAGGSATLIQERYEAPSSFNHGRFALDHFVTKFGFLHEDAVKTACACLDRARAAGS